MNDNEQEEYSRFMPGSDSGRKSQSSVPTESAAPDDKAQIPEDTILYFKEKARDAECPDKTTDISEEKAAVTPSDTTDDGKERSKLLTARLWLAIGLPVVAVVCLVLGLAIGSHKSVSGIFMSKEARDQEAVNQAIVEKLGPAIYTVQSEYVDELPLDTLLDMALDGMMNSLDPHSLYISASDVDKVNEELEGEFSGVGISFIIYNDSIAVVDVIKGGPASKVGVQRGDRIVSADGKSLTGKDITSETVYNTLRGKKGSKVMLKVKRPGSDRLLTIPVTRSGVPVSSVEASYILDDGKTGYIKLSSFTTSTYSETINALNKLRAAGAEDFIFDLRANPGGFMDQAVMIANEFLPVGRGIVYTKARRKENEMNILADGTGAFQKSKVAVIIDENSASASEIIAGAFQDNDRGVIVGRRSFGKGLVQNQFDIAGGGALRLTVARYFTPSGRSIQKDYKLGDKDSYSEDLLSRYSHGELFNADSIKLDKTKLFKTVGGRSVYGGGGIMPDIFVPEDTSSYTPYYVDAMNSGLIMNFSFKIADTYRPLLKNVRTEEQLFRIVPDDSRLLSAFVEYAEENGLPGAWFYINMSRDMIVNKIKAFIARDILNDNLFFKYYNLDDTTLMRAIEALDDESLPTEPQMH